MATHARLAALCLPVLLICPGIGCDSHPDAPSLTTSTEEAVVKGTVRVKGKAVSGGTLTFRASHVRRQNVPNKDTPINKDGTYEIKTLVGENYVAIECKEMKTKELRQFLDDDQLIMVKSGENTIDLEIPPRK